MGNWAIIVTGTGCHHNGKLEIDADLLTKEFVKALKKQGHSIESATFTHGGREDFTKTAHPATEPGPAQIFPEGGQY